jgi:hypothetical protein
LHSSCMQFRIFFKLLALQTLALKFGATREKFFQLSQASGQAFEHLTIGSSEDRELARAESKTLLSL